MRNGHSRQRIGGLAAFLAVALLLLAGVRSNVMQAAMGVAGGGPASGAAAAAMPHCMGMDGHAAKPGKARARCEYCAVAGHAPVCATAPPPPPPGLVAWIGWRPAAALGPRGPPGVQARARGPPARPLIA